MPESFAPIADENARVLILGTMPSVESLRRQQYYGNPQNTFWRILFALWDKPLPEDYADRCAFLLSKQLALWDVLGSCEREGSADTAIESPQSNDFAALADRCPHLRGLVFNSRNAQVFYERLVKPDPFAGCARLQLPSTSPARAMRFERKLSLWRPLRTLLESTTAPEEDGE